MLPLPQARLGRAENSSSGCSSLWPDKSLPPTRVSVLPYWEAYLDPISLWSQNW